MESLTFVLRRGGEPLDYAERWHDAISENEVRRLKASGVNIVLVTLMKGAGPRAEAPDIEAARQFVEVAHRYGIKVGGYVGSSLFYEQMFADEPDSKNWIQVDEYGHPLHYQAAQTFRYMACRNNPGYVAFIKRALKTGIVDLKMDMIHFDQLMWWPAPRSCHCDVCQRMFRDYIRERYPPQLSKARFGYPTLPTLRIPEFGLAGPPVTLPELINPLMQEWANFRAWSLERVYQQFADYIHSLNPAAVVQGNPDHVPGSECRLHVGRGHIAALGTRGHGVERRAQQSGLDGRWPAGEHDPQLQRSPHDGQESVAVAGPSRCSGACSRVR